MIQDSLRLELVVEESTKRIVSIHVGGSPDGKEVEGFTEEICERIWNLFRTTDATRWGQVGLGIVHKVEFQMGYDLNVLVELENKDYMLDCWMWNDSIEDITNWRKSHGDKYINAVHTSRGY